MLAVVYLVFNEGYARRGPARAGDLCAEAIRLGRMLAELMPDEPEALGLLALMLLHDSRRDARVGADGALVVLEEQDRSRWDTAEIAEGRGAGRAGAAAAARRARTRLQAAIAALHAEAATRDDRLAADRRALRRARSGSRRRRWSS